MNGLRPLEQLTNGSSGLIVSKKITSHDPEVQQPTIKFRFNQKPSQEYLNILKKEYKEDGWHLIENEGYCMWLNGDRTYSHSINKQNGRWMYIDEKWIVNLKLRG